MLLARLSTPLWSAPAVLSSFHIAVSWVKAEPGAKGSGQWPVRLVLGLKSSEKMPLIIYLLLTTSPVEFIRVNRWIVGLGRVCGLTY